MENNPSTQISSESLTVDSSTGTFNSNITQYYNTVTNTMEPILSGKNYFVYMMVSETGNGIGSTEAFYQNNVFSKSQQVSFSQSVQGFQVTTNGITPSTFSNRTIMYKNRTIHFKWNMKFSHNDVNEFQLSLFDKDDNPIVLTPLTTDPLFDYNVSYQFSDETLFSNGRVRYSLVYTPTSQT